MTGADHLLLEFVLIIFAALAMLFAFHWFKQPSIIAYILAGVVIGPFGFGLISDTALITILGELGVLMLLFFIGTEISLSHLIRNWRVVVLGTVLQISGSVAFMSMLGFFFDWELPRIILLGFVISLSSTAVILKYLEERGMIASKIGKDVVGVLLAQDLLIVPMLIILSTFGGSFEVSILVLQMTGAFLIGLFLFIVFRKKITLPERIGKFIQDGDNKLFAALMLCFGAALVTSAFHLSLGMGAFIGGIVAARIRNLDWIREELHSYKTLLLALFFVSIGLLLDLNFLLENIFLVLAILGSIILINTFINSMIFKSLKRPWKYSIYAGVLLAPLGEFSFFLASVGFQTGVIGDYGYQMAIAIVVLSLTLSPLWIRLFKRYEEEALKQT